MYFLLGWGRSVLTARSTNDRHTVNIIHHRQKSLSGVWETLFLTCTGTGRLQTIEHLLCKTNFDWDWDLSFRIYTGRLQTKVSGTYLLKSSCGGYEPQNVSSHSWWWRWRWWWQRWWWWRRWSGAQVEEVLTTYLLNPAVSVISCTTSGLSVPFMQHWVSITDSH